MSLRIRRGTEAQRTGATFDLGEIVYTTDTNKLYVGDGVNAGGRNILATSAGLGLVWNTTTQRLDFNGNGTGIVNVQADAAPSLGGNLNLNNRNITGTGNVNITGTVTATQFVGVRVSSDTAPQLGGNLNLNNRNITGTGNVNITGTVTAGSLTLSGQTVTAGTSTLILASSSDQTAQINGITTGVYGSALASLSLRGSKGTLASPANTAAGDFVTQISMEGYAGGSYKTMGSILGQWMPGAIFTDANPAAAINFSVGAGGSNYQFAQFNSFGVFFAPILSPGSYAGSGTYPTGPAGVGGAIIFDSTTKKFMGWDGTTWNILG